MNAVSDDERIESERRKIIMKSLPFMINAAWQAHSALSPANLASTAITEYRKMDRNARLQDEETISLAKGISHLELKSEGGGRLSLVLTRKDIVELVGQYLMSQFLKEGSWGSKFVATTDYPGYDGVIDLANKTIFAKVVEETFDEKWIFAEADKAERINPNEVWIFSLKDGFKSDIIMGPIFVGENKVLRGRFRVMSVTDAMREITDGRFAASILGDSENGTRFLLSRHDQIR